jgi:COP9 signalosome complex subunit 7
MEQQRAINALESYIILSKDAKAPRAAADLILRATSDPNTFVFAELLHTPNIDALRASDEYRAHYKLLQIFAWGTWADYKGALSLYTRESWDCT